MSFVIIVLIRFVLEKNVIIYSYPEYIESEVYIIIYGKFFICYLLYCYLHLICPFNVILKDSDQFDFTTKLPLTPLIFPFFSPCRALYIILRGTCTPYPLN